VEHSRLISNEDVASDML